MLKVECAISIKQDGTSFIDPYKASMLKEIDRCGSINSASKNLKISYQHAWTMLNELNKAHKEPLVLSFRGGSGGGGAELTPHGKRVLQEYAYVETSINEMVKKINVEINL